METFHSLDRDTGLENNTSNPMNREAEARGWGASLRQARASNKPWSQRQTKHNQKRCRGERVADTREIPAVVLHGIRHSHTHAS